MMVRLKQLLKESDLYNSQYMTSLKVDDIGTFWIVDKPTQYSTLQDICYECDLARFFLVVLGGGTDSEKTAYLKDIVAITKDANKAKMIAEKLLASKARKK